MQLIRRLMSPASAACVAMAFTALQSAAQGQVVDRGTADLGPNNASHRVVHPGIAQFSPEAALTDRFAGNPATRLADLYHQPDAQRRYLYQAPGVTALYNQSDYLTRDGLGVRGINGNNTSNGQVFPITPADIVYVLSPELLQQRPAVQDRAPVPGQVDRRVAPTPMQAGPYANSVGGMLDTRIDAHLDTAQPNIVDVQAIHDQRRGAQRDPRLVERSRRWHEERERERAAQAEQQDEDAETQADEGAADGALESPGADEAAADDGAAVGPEPSPTDPPVSSDE
ncbi:MAG: hypothetical protein AAGA29_14670 [Planctomycetota bacterium]